MDIYSAFVTSFFLAVIAALSIPEDNLHDASGGTEAVKVILSKASKPDCSLILIGDNSLVYFSDLIKVWRSESTWGVAVYEIKHNSYSPNATDATLSRLIPIARQVRRASWCSFMIALSHNASFLRSFAESSMLMRLLRWVTKLLVVTHIGQHLLQDLMTQHWTYTMMNVMFLNYGSEELSNRWSLYGHLPYSPGGSKVVKVADWIQGKGFSHSLEYKLFPEKYENFHGSTINVTAKPFAPYWIEDEYTREDGSTGLIYSGTDGNLFQVIAKQLNFTFNVIPPVTWDIGLEMVARRESFMTPVYCMVLPNRLKMFEFSYEYEFAFLGFGMLKPSLVPQWQSLYYPLTNGVWLGTLATLVLVPPLFYMVTRSSEEEAYQLRLNKLKAMQEILGTLLGQNFTGHLPTGGPGRTLMLAWLMFAFILGTAYRGNLTASLTSPKYETRAEKLEQLVQAADRATWGSYGAPFKVFFSQSSYEVFRKLADLLDIGPSVKVGLQQALEDKRSATISGLRYMQDIIADKYTRPDGTTDLYIGKEAIIPGLSGWPIPHDAPYKANMDWCMMAVLEGGLYEQWSNEFIEKTRLRSARRQRAYLTEGTNDGIQESKQDENQRQQRIVSLSLNHMQGPLILYSLGLCLGLVSFTSEVFSGLVTSK